MSMTLADQRRIPWTSYYSSGVASKQAAVDLVREFLELEPTPALGSGAPTAKTERDVRRGRVGLYFMAAFCCVFLGIGVTMAAKEQRRLSVFQPVTATVLSTRVEEHSDSDGSTYEPVVVYRYRVQDREYTASRVTPLKESRSGKWARRVTATISGGERLHGVLRSRGSRGGVPSAQSQCDSVGVHRDSARGDHVHHRGDPGQPGDDEDVVSGAVVRLTRVVRDVEPPEAVQFTFRLVALWRFPSRGRSA